MKLAPFGKCQLALEPAILQIHAERDEREALFGSPADQFPDLAAVEKQLARAKRIMICVVSVGVWTDVTVQQPYLAALDEAIGILEIYATISGRLDLGSRKNDSGLQPFKNLVVMKGLAVNRDLLVHLMVPGVAPNVPGPDGCGGGEAGFAGNPVTPAGS